MSGPIHVVADRFHYDGATETALYEGSARLWQGGNLLEADWLEMDRRRGRLVARNKVYSLFQKTEQPPDFAGSLPVASSASSSSHSGSPHSGLSHAGLADAGRFEIRSDYLIYIYQQTQHKALYQGSVRMQNAASTLTSEELELFFHASNGEAG